MKELSSFRNTFDLTKNFRWILIAGVAVVGFHLARMGGLWSAFVALHLWGLLELRKLPSPRKAFYSAGLVGLGLYAPPLAFFWGIFGPAAAVLWLVLAIWPAFFVLGLHLLEFKAGRSIALAILGPTADPREPRQTPGMAQ
jgi:hypothetical protein